MRALCGSSHVPVSDHGCGRQTAGRRETGLRASRSTAGNLVGISQRCRRIGSVSSRLAQPRVILATRVPDAFYGQLLHSTICSHIIYLAGTWIGSFFGRQIFLSLGV